MILCALPLVLSACSNFSTQRDIIEVAAQPVERVPLSLPDPSPLIIDDPKWIIVTPDNIDSVWQQLGKDRKDIVVFGLTDDGYEQLSLDFAEMRNHIAQQRQIILQYKQYYEPIVNSEPD